MNDFTKEELEDLIEWGNTYCADMPTIAKMHHINLLGKIESMIDNYNTTINNPITLQDNEWG